ncbi:MAG: RNA ligase [Gemmataceae bacterium]
MELRLDRLLARLRASPEAILRAIDADPLLVRRTSGGLVLANAGPLLYTPLEEHQLFAKGIVYERDPYRLVSLPLIKIYNLGERGITLEDLAALLTEPRVRLRFLHKMDGSLVQVFRAKGRVWFTTRGMLEGAVMHARDPEEESAGSFDYLAAARQIASQRYPQVVASSTLLEGITLLFELIHPDARKVTNYGERSDLILLGAFDQRAFRYLDHDEVGQLATRHGLTLVSAFTPPGDTLVEQIQHLLQLWAGTDEEGAVLCFERPGEVVYRVKVKSPDYLQLMRLMALCTYERTVQFIDTHTGIHSWDDLEKVLQSEGRNHVPEELLTFYRDHWLRFQRYLSRLEALRAWAEQEFACITEQLGPADQMAPPEFRREFARCVQARPYPGLMFAALDGRLNNERLRKMFREEKAVDEAFTRLGLTDPATAFSQTPDRRTARPTD